MFSFFMSSRAFILQISTLETILGECILTLELCFCFLLLSYLLRGRWCDCFCLLVFTFNSSDCFKFCLLELISLWDGLSFFSISSIIFPSIKFFETAEEEKTCFLGVQIVLDDSDWNVLFEVFVQPLACVSLNRKSITIDMNFE